MAKIVIDAGHGKLLCSQRNSYAGQSDGMWIYGFGYGYKIYFRPGMDQKIALGISEGICEVFGGKIVADEDISKIQPANRLASMPKGATVQCYGYYTEESDGTVWLYVVYNGQTGFASKRYLKKQRER